VSTDYKTTTSSDNHDHIVQTQQSKTHYLEQTGRKKPFKHSSKKQKQIDWRRNRLSDYLVKGMALPEISGVMNIPYNTLY
jgi:hypothetical protein